MKIPDFSVDAGETLLKMHSLFFKGKSNHLKMILWILVVSMLLPVFSVFFAVHANDVDDISDQIDFTRLYLKEDEGIEENYPENSLLYFDNIYYLGIDLKKISSNENAKWKVGDYFTFDLPEIFSYITEDNTKIEDKKFSIEDETMKLEGNIENVGSDIEPDYKLVFTIVEIVDPTTFDWEKWQASVSIPVIIPPQNNESEKTADISVSLEKMTESGYQAISTMHMQYTIESAVEDIEEDISEEETTIKEEPASNQSVVVESDRAITTIDHSKLELQLVSSNNPATPIANAKFEIYADADRTTVIATRTTDSNGKMLLNNLNPGIYYLKQITTGSSYMLPSGGYRFRIDSAEYLAVPNLIGKTLVNAKNVVNGNFMIDATEEYSSQPQGTIISQSPSSGTAPKGSTIRVVISKGPKPQINFNLLPSSTTAIKKGSYIQLVDGNTGSNTKAVGNANNSVTNVVQVGGPTQDTEELKKQLWEVTECYSTASGQLAVELKNVYSGQYLTRDANGNKLLLGSTPSTFIFEPRNQNRKFWKIYTVVPNRIVKNRYIHRNGNLGFEPGGILFNIYTPLPYPLPQDNDSSSELPKNDIGDIWDTSGNVITLNPDVNMRILKTDSGIKLVNDPIYKNAMEFTKLGSTGEPVSGARFMLQKWNGNAWVNIIQTQSVDNGYFSFGGLPAGDFRIVETAVSNTSQYDLPTDAVSELSVAANGVVSFKEGYSRTITNTKNGGTKITILKVDSKDNQIKLKDAEFKIKRFGGGYEKTLQTNSNGELTFDNLPIGTYIIEEIKAPKDYKQNTIWYTFQVDSDFTIRGLAGVNGKSGTIKVENTPITLDVVLYKKNRADNSPLNGVEFELQKDGVKLGTIISESDGKVNLKDLRPGNYKLYETKTKDGYILPNDSILDFKVTGDGNFTWLKGEIQIVGPQIVLYNDQYALQILNVDSGKRTTKVKGVTFQLYSDADCQQVVRAYDSNKNQTTSTQKTEFTSDVDGSLKIYGLAANKTYYLKVIKAADHYLKPEGVASFTIDAQGNITWHSPPEWEIVTSDSHSLTLAHQWRLNMPESGTKDILILRMVGLLLLIGGGVIAIRSHNHK